MGAGQLVCPIFFEKISRLRTSTKKNPIFAPVNTINYLLRYLQFLATAKTKYYIHSPFVFNLINEVIYDKRHYYAFDDIALLREKLLQNKHSITIADYGAGSTRMPKHQRRIAQIATHSSVSDKVGRLLFKLALHQKAQHLLELGTALGISTLYQARAVGANACIHTIEGCPQTAAYAKRNFEVLTATNIQLHVGRFETQLPKVLAQMPTLDMVLFDGNHRKMPTLQYFEQCLPLAHENSVFIFDDIYWSAEMVAAWEQIKQHPKVRLSIDLFRVGLVFFKTDQAKEHFKLYF